MNEKLKNKIYPFFIVFLFLLSFVFYGSIKSSSLDNVSGYAWGGYAEGGMGWLSFNCISGSDCNISNFGVNIDPNSGYISGYAWSNNLGWLRFGGLSGFPTGGGTTTDNAKLTGNNITGWARFCSVFVSGCSGTLKSSTDLGGWDGWVALSGTGYGVVRNESALTGYAWGGPVNVGWINFTNVVFGLSPQNATLTLFPDSYSVGTPYSTTLRWTSNINTLENCTASSVPVSPAWNGSVGNPTTPPVAPNSKVVSVPGNNTQYTLTCYDTANNNNAVVATTFVNRVNPLESVVLSHSGVTNNATDLTWTTSFVVAGSCVASANPYLDSWNGAKANSGTQSNVPVPVGQNTFSLTCTGYSSGAPVVGTVNLNADVKIPVFIEN
jgi:hypothetical protein